MFEYVASGLSTTRINSGGAKHIMNSFDIIQNSIPEQCFSFLFNSFTEKTLGEDFKIIKDMGCLYNIHADSGGLQMITRNLEPNAELRAAVYENQAKYSDVAMSFDEIPVLIETADGTTDVSNLNGRYFDMSRLDEKAIQSGYNLKKQVRYFEERDTDAKALMIVQGNCLDTYERWTDKLASVMGSDMDLIGGLAMSAGSIGMGLYEDCVRAIALKLNPYNKDKVHLLGIGSINRMLPFVIMQGLNWFGEGYHISYDSTSHSRALWGGLSYYTPTEKIKCKSHYDIRRVYDNIVRDMKVEYSYDLFYKWCHSRSSMGRWCELTKDDDVAEWQFSVISTTFLLSTVYNFMRELEDVKNNIDTVSVPEIAILKTMAEITTKADGERWLSEHKKYLKSKPVAKKFEDEKPCRNTDMTQFF